MSDPNQTPGVTRREFVATTVAAGAALAATDLAVAAPDARGPVMTQPADVERIELKLNVNGVERVVKVDPRAALVDTLRDGLGLFGTKKGCDHGQCGACTVLMDGRRVLSCLVLAQAATETKIVTIEGLADGETLHPMQSAFIRHDAFQCGFCTPGQICSAVGLVAEGTAKSEAEIREQMSGNLCRCGAYVNIVAAVREVANGAV